MRIKCNDVIGEFLAWNLSNADCSFVVVKLSDGKLAEWRLNYCCIVEAPTAKAMEAGATVAAGGPSAVQQLKQAIALVRGALCDLGWDCSDVKTVECVLKQVEQRACV